MKASNYLLHTLRDKPADAELTSHALMLRAGLIQKVSSGLYSYLPLGLRALKKVESIVREEMNASGALEALMPMLVPENLLTESGRWHTFKEELFRLHDRHKASFALSPTNEENFTQMVKESIPSYRSLPINLYQIETKFRDEIRPRYGVMRGRQFIMKDAYSFHRDDSSLLETYSVMRDTYTRIFTRMGLDFVHVEASSGAMGGSQSEEFIVKSNAGEESILSCPACGYSANIETAKMTLPPLPEHSDSGEMEKVATPDAGTIEKVCAMLDKPATLSIKTLVYEVETEEGSNTFEPLIAILRGDCEVSEDKLAAAVDGRTIRLAGEKTITKVFQCEKGYLAPIRLAEPVLVIIDVSLDGLQDGVAGANVKDHHLIHVNVDRDIKTPLLQAGKRLNKTFVKHAEIYQAKEHGLCPQPHCKKPLAMLKGIEVGHIFALGDKYTRALTASILDETGKPFFPLMGCYGIGIDRCLAAIIETNYDDHGIIFPREVAPFDVVLITLEGSSEGPLKDEAVAVHEAGEQLYAHLQSNNIDVLWDDRRERPGVKFKDADLIGIPIQIVLSPKLLAKSEDPKNPLLECKRRASPQEKNEPNRVEISRSKILEYIHALTPQS